MCKALLLSYYKTGGLEYTITKLLRRYLCHCNSQVAEANARYYALELEQAIIVCFFELQVIKESLKKKQ